MYFNRLFGKCMLCTVLFVPATVWAAHPLITDDAGTQGTGKFQLEVNGQYDSDKETVGGVSIKSTGGQAAMALTYGASDGIDIAVGLPYLWIKEKDDGVQVINEHGVSDATVDVKWRFFEKEGLSFAVKPGMSSPTGDEDKGLGAGKAGYHIYLIGTKDVAPWSFSANLGYMRNVTKFDVEEENLWHASLAATYELIKGFKIVGDIGQEKNCDKSVNNDPAYALAGLIYSPNENIDLDIGVKYGLTSSETDWSLLAGTTFRF